MYMLTLKLYATLGEEMMTDLSFGVYNYHILSYTMTINRFEF